jgi:hypothetical protein
MSTSAAGVPSSTSRFSRDSTRSCCFQVCINNRVHITKILAAERVLIGMPTPIRRSVWTGDYYEIAIWIPHPALPMIRTAITIGRISMPRQNYLDAHLGRALHDRIKIVDFKPQQNAVPIWSIVSIADRTVMMFYIKAV